MKRIILFASLVVLCVCSLHAQVRVGLLGGIHQSTVIEKNDLPDWDYFKGNYKGRTGGHIGIIADMPITPYSNFYFQSGVVFYAKGRKYQFSKDSTRVYSRPAGDSIVNSFYSVSQQQYLNYIDIPLNIVYKIKLGKTSKFIIGGGPYLSLFYGGYTKKEEALVGISYTSKDNEDLPVGKGPGKYATFDYGVNALAGFEFGRVFITANYSRGLKNFYEPEDYKSTDYKHQVFGATLGVFIGRQDKQPVVKIKDSDKDGVVDSTDKCPTIAGPAMLKGCPDRDGDGIPDFEDICPDEAGRADNYGCPYFDRDGDGVLDKNDKCPDTPGTVDNNGCPDLDTDKDGVVDRLDKCPEIPGVIRYDGCPVPDKDQDGVNDEEDRCPDIVGTIASNGCPDTIREEIKEKVEYVAQRIQFRINAAELTPASYKVLDDVVSILEANPAFNLRIEGHTSSEGSRDANLRLSQSRANAVKTYLVSKGIDSNRLESIGFGPDKLLNADKTPEEKAKNRRVELELSN